MPEHWPLHLRIVQAGATVLHRPARALERSDVESTEVQHLIDHMFSTLRGTGVGLAAPQIGVGLQLVVIEDAEEYHSVVPPDLLAAQERVPIEPQVLINPRLLVEDAAPAEFFEGCLSVDGYRAIVPRARSVRVEALDRSGAPFERLATGWYARILQHEVDHLAGRLYLQRMLPRTFVSAASFAQFWSTLSIDDARALLG